MIVKEDSIGGSNLNDQTAETTAKFKTGANTVRFTGVADFVIEPPAPKTRRYTDFQTPVIVAEFMASLMDDQCGLILEPTPGLGNLVQAAKHKGRVIAPENFEDIIPGTRYDWAIMNPPFTPMIEGYRYLSEVMNMTDNIVALLPWFIIINSEKRLNAIMKFGLVSVTSLPRKTFPGCRIQCCILKMQKGFKGETIFNKFSW
jgi:hypothetical protein